MNLALQLSEIEKQVSALISENIEYKTQLTKAKELLEQWVLTSNASDCDIVNIIDDTEHFLSEVEK